MLIVTLLAVPVVTGGLAWLMETALDWSLRQRAIARNQKPNRNALRQAYESSPRNTSSQGLR